jgi:hypothetical protein
VQVLDERHRALGNRSGGLALPMLAGLQVSYFCIFIFSTLLFILFYYLYYFIIYILYFLFAMAIASALRLATPIFTDYTQLFLNSKPFFPFKLVVCASPAHSPLPQVNWAILFCAAEGFAPVLTPDVVQSEVAFPPSSAALVQPHVWPVPGDESVRVPAQGPSLTGVLPRSRKLVSRRHQRNHSRCAVQRDGA